MKTIIQTERLGEATLRGLNGEGTSITIKPIIGMPKLTPEGDAFICQVMVEGLLAKPQLVFGADSFQAICLSFSYLAGLIRKCIVNEKYKPILMDNFDKNDETNSIDWLDLFATQPTVGVSIRLSAPVQELKSNLEIFELAAELLLDFKGAQATMEVELSLGRPVRDGDKWSCTYVINGLLGAAQIVHAEESLHALCLAIRQIHNFLLAAQDHGILYSRDRKLGRTMIPYKADQYFHPKLKEIVQ